MIYIFKFLAIFLMLFFGYVFLDVAQGENDKDKFPALVGCLMIVGGLGLYVIYD